MDWLGAPFRVEQGGRPGALRGSRELPAVLGSTDSKGGSEAPWLVVLGFLLLAGLGSGSAGLGGADLTFLRG